MNFNEILERRNKAQNVVSNMCNGDHKWLMSIPVDEKRDSDILICDSLMDINGLIKELQSIKYPHNMIREQWRHELAARAMERGCDDLSKHESVSKWSYQRADAMLKEGDNDE